MYIEQLYTNCLAEAAYYIESDGEAAIIDPIRETGLYLELAQKRGTKIKYVFETHFHADFISGHIDLAKQTGARIIFGPGADTSYKVYNAKDNEVFSLGKISFRAMHTPGHTPESTCYLLLDENNKEYSLFSGDTLFVGDVGRPDLLDGKMTKEELAGMMYDSLNNKIKKLPDEVLVYPAHGPGSSCGKNLGKETWSTIGIQKKTNYALRDMSRNEFIQEVTDGLLAPPAYFFSDARINKQGYDSLDSVLKKNMKALKPVEVQQEISLGAFVLDTRDPDDFEKGFIPGSINIGLNGMFAIWAGTVLNIDQPMVIVCNEGKEEETVTRLARVGYEKICGYLSNGISSWKKEGFDMDSVQSVSAQEFASKVKHGVKVLDVRKFSEAESGYIRDANLLPLADLSSKMTGLENDETIYIHCAGGYRSMIAASMLKAKGYAKVINVYKGWSEIKTTNVPIETAIPVANND
jgi:glyoxylase-like metal-dependent hydrolase (beta-lactamase superfamily II)/rhodanese-related sulfurtransferase